MKTGIHPEYHVVTVACACGNSFVTRSTRKSLKLDICSQCHPFFTGKQKFVDTEGRIDKFLKKFETAKVHKAKSEEMAKAAKLRAAKARERAAKAPAKESEAGKKVKTLTSRPKA